MTDTDDIARLAALAEYLRDDLGTPGHNADADAIDRVLARCAEFDGIDKAIDQQCADYADLHARIQQLEAVAEAAAQCREAQAHVVASQYGWQVLERRDVASKLEDTLDAALAARESSGVLRSQEARYGSLLAQHNDLQKQLEAVAEAAQAYFDTREFVATQGVRATAPSEWLPTKERLRAAFAALRDSRLSDRGKL